MSQNSELECSICLQICVQPVQLPCTHVFCYLCMKGIAQRNRKCALCRVDIPQDFMQNPKLIDQTCTSSTEQHQTQVFDDGYQWYYEGANGWWRYDTRTSVDIEAAYKVDSKSSVDLMIAGYMYSVDFNTMIQARVGSLSRRRRIKRDVATIEDCKGVAGVTFTPTHTPTPTPAHTATINAPTVTPTPQ